MVANPQVRFWRCARKRARPTGPAQSSTLHYCARSGPTKEAHRRAMNRSGGLLRSVAGTTAPHPLRDPSREGLRDPSRGIKGPLEGPIQVGPAVSELLQSGQKDRTELHEAIARRGRSVGLNRPRRGRDPAPAAFGRCPHPAGTTTRPEDTGRAFRPTRRGTRRTRTLPRRAADRPSRSWAAHAVTVRCPRLEGTTQVVGCEDLIQTWTRPMVESGMPTSRTYPPHQVGAANGHWPPPRRPSEARVHSTEDDASTLAILVSAGDRFRQVH
jgi:hypothetical protein